MPERLSPERWRVLIPHLDRALELPAEERGPWLAALRAQDAALADDLAALLAKRELLERKGFLEATPVGPAPQASLAGQVIGDYTLRSLLGQGGMGSVWLADRSDGRYQGQAAAKLLNASLVGRDGESRFKREASILARLRHPHIAQLIDAGVSATGQPYLVLERVDGLRIDRYCDDRRLGLEARIRLFLDVLAAVSHAHANLVVHRDLKPSNVLVATDGQVKLLDFGIAKLLDSEAAGEVTALTREGMSALTPEYAAPEQLTGGAVTTATDVYALGVLLYLLLTGRHPAGGDKSTPAELVRAIVDAEPLRVSDAVAAELGAATPGEVAARRATTTRKLRGALRGDLDNIVAKALKKRPAERYASVEAMADDLRRFLDHRPVSARADALGYRARKFVARNRLALAAAMVVVLALVTGAGVAVWQARTAARQRDRALVELDRAEATNDLASFLLSEATPSVGRPISNADLLARGEALVGRRFADDPALRVHMLLTLAERYHQNEQYDRWQATVERAFAASHGIGDVGLRSRAACAKAAGLDDQGRVAEADALLAAALRELAALPEPESDEAYCRVVEANMANRRGDAGRGVAAAERAVALEDARRGPAGRGLEALFVLANAYLVAERSAAADGAFRRLTAELERQGRGDTRDAALVLNNWSTMLMNGGQYLKAVPLAERAVRIARERDSEHGATPVMLRSYATALCAVGRCAEAVPVAEEAVAKAPSTGSLRRRYGALSTAATVEGQAGNLDRAAHLLREAEGLLEAGRAEMPGQQAVLERRLAQLALLRGDHGAAVGLAERAATREEDLRIDTHATMQLMLVLAEARNAHGDFDAARVAAERALAILGATRGGMDHSSFAGQAHLERGVALAGLGDGDAGRKELQQALDHLRPTVGPEAPSTRRSVSELARVTSIATTSR
jgi:serine/threonine-protein kinase